MSDIAPTRRALVKRILEGAGTSSPSERRAAFKNSGFGGSVGDLIDKVACRAHSVTDDDISRVKEVGVSEDEIFEIVICAAVGQATRQYDDALAALKAATGKG